MALQQMDRDHFCDIIHWFFFFMSMTYYQENSMQMRISNHIIEAICYSLCVFFLSAFKKRFEIEKQYARTDFLTGISKQEIFF